MPNPVLSGSLVSPSLLAILMDMKYNKMMPLYRQEKAFEELGIDIPRQNMGFLGNQRLRKVSKTFI